MKFIGNDQSYMGKVGTHNPRVFFGFSSLADLTDHVASLPAHPKTERATIEFYGTESVAAAIKLARSGWAEGASQAEKIAEEFQTERAIQRRPSYGVAGGSVSVGRMMAGNPEHMRRRTKQPGRKVITLYTGVGVLARVPASVMARRAAVVAAVADRLEMSGYSCEIVAINTNRVGMGDNSCSHQFAVTLKHAGERLNINDVIFGLGHPSMQRRLFFSLVTGCNDLRNVWSSQGGSIRSFPVDTEEFYISSPTPDQADMLHNAKTVQEWFDIIAPKKLREILQTQQQRNA